MGTPQKLQMDRIIGIFEAIESVKDNTKLEVKIAYRLGRFQDSCRSALKTYERLQSKLRKEYQQAYADLKAKLDKETSEEAKAAINNELRELNNKYQADQQDLLENDEEVKVPEFVISDFEGKEIPVKFFGALADFIKE